jgi:nucleoside-diphosphate-sugar epimerase
MRVLVAGASGVVGRNLLPVLVKAGYTVFGMSRSADKRVLVESLGAQHVVADALNRQAVSREVARVRPDIVVHELTAIPQELNLRKFDQQFALTNRLRTEGTAHLLEAALAAGARKFIAQSYAGWPYARVGGPIKTEDDPLDPNLPAVFRTSIAAIRYLESAVPQAKGINGIVLRYGSFYGPGTSGEWMLDQIRKRRLPIIGAGGAIWSFIHIQDVATATLAALENGKPGIYNIADDEPAAVSIWLPDLARLVGAKPPRHVPVWLARLLVGDAGVLMMTEARGSSNQKAKSTLGWTPRWKSWREGFRSEAESEQRKLAA